MASDFEHQTNYKKYCLLHYDEWHAHTIVDDVYTC